MKWSTKILVAVVLLLAATATSLPQAEIQLASGAISTVTANSSTDVTVTLDAHCTAAFISSRSGTAFKIAFASGGVAAGNYKTIPANSEWQAFDLRWTTTGTVIYFRSTISSDVIEVEQWIGS